MSNYRRRLPHIQPVGKELFITFRLHGSLPPSRYPPASKKLTAGQSFAWVDRYLDRTRVGPLFLRNEAIADIVVDSIRYGVDELRHYELGAFVVMPNHVHMLILPLTETRRLMQSLKGFTAREANKVLGRTGHPFWQRESYDHWVRDRSERASIRTYIEENPVKAALVNSPEEYRWSSAWREIPADEAEALPRGLDARRQRAATKRLG